MSIYGEGRLEKKIIVPILSRMVSKACIGRIRFHYRRMARKLASLLGREVSERIVEYPWILKNLDIEKKQVLDVGMHACMRKCDLDPLNSSYKESRKLFSL